MPLPGISGRCSASQASRSGLVAKRGSPAGAAMSRASGPRGRVARRRPSCSATSSTTRSFAVAVVASTGTSGGQRAQDPPMPPVVGTEVVAPVGDAVRLVDDEEPERRPMGGSMLGRGTAGWRAARARRAGRRSRPRASRLDERRHSSMLPGVDRRRRAGRGARGLDLVAHQGEQRGDDERRPVARLAPDARGDPVDEALAPARALHDERARAVADDRLDRLALTVAEAAPGPNMVSRWPCSGSRQGWSSWAEYRPIRGGSRSVTVRPEAAAFTSVPRSLKCIERIRSVE